MSTNYSSSSAPSSASSSPLSTIRISAGTAVKLGFFGALGATLFSLILTAIGVAVAVILALLGYSLASLIPPR